MNHSERMTRPIEHDRPIEGVFHAMNATEATNLFTQHQTARGFSPATIRRRSTSLASLARHLAPLDLLAASTDDLEEWLTTYRRSPRTMHAYGSDARQFYAWAVKRRLIAHSPASDLGAVRVPRTMPRPIAISDCFLALARARDFDLRLMLALALFAGLRRSEIAHLCVEDVRLGATPQLIVRAGKGGKDRMVPVHRDLALLLAARKRPGRYFDVTPNAVGQRCATHLRRCGIDASLHQLRHTFCTEFMRACSGNLSLGARVMGHNDPSTTQGYDGWAGGPADGAVAVMFDRAA
jgi:integrase